MSISVISETNSSIRIASERVFPHIPQNRKRVDLGVLCDIHWRTGCRNHHRREWRAWETLEMSCKNFRELRKQIYEITEIQYETFANKDHGVLRVCKDTYLRWAEMDELGRNVGNKFEKIMESYDEFKKAFDEAATYYPDLRKKPVSEHQWIEIDEHYTHWKGWKETQSPHLGPSTHLRLPMFSLVLKVLRWKNRQANAGEPFYTQIIDGQKIDVYDESVMYRSGILDTHVITPLNTTPEMLVSSSGTLEPIRILPESSDFGKRQPPGYTLIQFKMAENDREILFGARIINGFQRKYEYVWGKTPDNTIADRFLLTVDFSEVIDSTPFTQCPKAAYINPSREREDIPCFRSPDAEVWYVKYEEELHPGAKIELAWSMIPTDARDAL